MIFLVIIRNSMDGSQENTAFQGIAESREEIVNSENGVEIRNLHVTPGQVVQKGGLLVELERPELTLKINEISHRLEELRLQCGMDRESIRSQIRQLKAEREVVRSETDHKIIQLQSRLSFNKELAADLESIHTGKQGRKKLSPIETEIENLKEERQLKLSQIQLQIDTLEKHLSSPENPVDVRTKSLERELTLLLEEKKKLLVYARSDGIVGSVLCKIGEKISPFVPIMTLYKESPSFVKAYIHEKVHHMAKVGEDVEVISLSDMDKRVMAEIVGTGSRIVEYPMRLRKRPDFQILGREVEIRLPKENPFLLGEKVMVYPLKNKENRFLVLMNRWFNKCLNPTLCEVESGRTYENS